MECIGIGRVVHLLGDPFPGLAPLKFFHKVETKIDSSGDASGGDDRPFIDDPLVVDLPAVRLQTEEGGRVSRGPVVG